MAEITRQADILVVASGHPHTLTGDMVKDGAVVIDVGVNRIPDASKKSGFRLIGDCDFDDLKETAGYITPVPGGVGPMTVAMLMENVVEAAKQNKYKIGGFNAYIVSDIAPGAGVSSSAAFEMMICHILNFMVNYKDSNIKIGG